jgi:hypothetical protein
MAGQHFGRLTVIDLNSGGKNASWNCICDCGNHITVSRPNLINGHVRSCGCLYEESRADCHKTHGLTYTNKRLRRIYDGMKSRCTNPNASRYERYGGRGITVCNEWVDDYAAFYGWAMANGYRDDLTIDRKDNDGNYEPSNCRWSDKKIQNRNSTNCRYLTVNGVTKTVAEWAEETGLHKMVITYRINHGWTPEKVIKAHKWGRGTL